MKSDPIYAFEINLKKLIKENKLNENIELDVDGKKTESFVKTTQ